MMLRIFSAIAIGLVLTIGTVGNTDLIGLYSDVDCEACSQVTQSLEGRGIPLDFIEEKTKYIEDSSEKYQGFYDKYSQLNAFNFVINWLFWTAVSFFALVIFSVIASLISKILASVVASLLVAGYIILVLYS